MSILSMLEYCKSVHKFNHLESAADYCLLLYITYPHTIHVFLNILVEIMTVK